jgi:2-amino-4-hydroxy-6-hydroxymethyldihydropteridine diphosphokinase
LGSNLGDQAATLMRAMLLLDKADRIEVRRVSQLIRTEPVGGPADQPAYVNGAAEVVTTLSPADLLAAMNAVETELGRDRDLEQRWGPRTCDLDLLLMDDVVIDTPELTIPHPRMHERAFVLEPLATIAPDVVHPTLRRTIVELLAEAKVTGLAASQAPAPGVAAPCEPVGAKLISVIGPVAAGKTTVAEGLSVDLPATLVREDYEGNPFLADSYLGDAQTRLPAQLYYLFSRVKQLARAGWPSEGVVVSDYGFCQDRVFAEMRLPADDFPVYDRVARRIAPLVRDPDVLVCLDAPEPALLERIEDRGRPFELRIDASFLAVQRSAYARIAEQAACEVLWIDTEAEDVRDAPVRERLVERLRRMLS